jgi:hypothetical protein
MKSIKLILINIFITTFLLLIIEATSSIFYYYKNGFTRSFASVWLVKKISNRFDQYRALSVVSKRPKFNFREIIVSPKNNVEKKFGAYSLSSYEKNFSKFIFETKENNIPIVILWLPTLTNIDTNNFFENYFKQISKKNKVDFISMKYLLKKKKNEIFLTPYDNHYTRFANNIISDKLNDYISSKNFSNKKNFICDDIKGMWAQNKYEIWDIIPSVPYALSTDEFGFRKTNVKDHDRSKKTLITIGDSFTFGPYLPYHDTYPSSLHRKLNGEWNIINGGVSGFGIRSELDLLKDNFECLKPDLIILQVLDNDIENITNAKYNEYNWKGEVLDLTKEEKTFYNYLNKNK